MSTRLLRTAHQLSSRALHWLHRAHRLGHGAVPPDATVDPAAPDTAYPPIGESALAASLVLRDGVAGQRDLAAAGETLEFCWHQLQGGNLLYERQLRFPQATDPLEAYAPFARSGYRHRELDGLLRSLAALRAAEAVELLPHHRLAVANARRITGLVHRPPDWAALAAATLLGGTPEPWTVDWSAGYRLGQSVFHLTDWGARPDDLPERLRGYLRAWLPVWVDVWLETGQWDLVATLLAADSCTGAPVCGPEPWERLCAAQHPSGLTPRDAEPVSPDPSRAFRDHERTAAVTVVAGTLALARLLTSPPV
ncbi:DUF6895 family protein [Kitasatospora sp. NPDC096147]|uniref:DUF6895 family protein n=1 Tax=Kitasatospora sp. NPDC096147 TaxID=3364093 RepID=UPI003806E097